MLPQPNVRFSASLLLGAPSVWRVILNVGHDARIFATAFA